MYKYILHHDREDAFLLAEMIILPSEKYIGEQMETIDVDAIHAVREFIIKEIAKKLNRLFLEIYKQLHQKANDQTFDVSHIGKRQLKNRCLLYLMLIKENESLVCNNLHQHLKRI